MQRSRSGLQRQVLALYKEALTAARALPAGPSAASAAAFVRSEFHKGQLVERLDFQRIEHLLRAGRKKLDALASADVSGFSCATPGGAARKP
jgi:succinate dehydrogenase assembly factor 1